MDKQMNGPEVGGVTWDPRPWWEERGEEEQEAELDLLLLRRDFPARWKNQEIIGEREPVCVRACVCVCVSEGVSTCPPTTLGDNGDYTETVALLLKERQR